MEVLKPGKKLVGFQYGGELKCNHCQCSFKYLDSDVGVHYDFIGLSVNQYWVSCPFCHYSITSCSEFISEMKDFGTLIGVALFIIAAVSPLLAFGYIVYSITTTLIR